MCRTNNSLVTVKSCVDWLSNNGAAYALLPLASQAVGGRVKNVRVLFSDPSLTMSAAIAQKMYRELEEKWRNAEREEERCTNRSWELAKAGQPLLIEMDEATPTGVAISENDANGSGRGGGGGDARIGKGDINIARLSEASLSLLFAWLSEEEPRYWEAACGGLYSLFEDEEASSSNNEDAVADEAPADEAPSPDKDGASVLRGIFAPGTTVPIGLLVTKNDGISIDFVSIRPPYRRRGVASVVVEVVEAQLVRAGIEVHNIESLEGAVDFWTRQGYREVPDDEAENDVQRSAAARRRRLEARRRKLPMTKKVFPECSEC